MDGLFAREVRRGPSRWSARTKPRRRGLNNTPRSSTDEPGRAAAAAAHTAADDGSPGTARGSCGARGSWPPGTWTPSASTRTARPKAGKARSEWSRVGCVSWIVVSPEAERPASINALLIWALGTAGVQVTPCSPRPSITSGARPLFALICAPIASSGAITRAMGRRCSDSSPTIVVRNGRPATSPASSLIVVPELAASSAPDGSDRPAQPRPSIRRPCGPSAVTRAPRARQHATVAATSAPGAKPDRNVIPTAADPSIT